MEKMKKNKLNWGTAEPSAIAFVENEIFNLNCYESVYPVKKDDVVLDIGASIGPFTWSIMDKASKVYAVEPVKNQINLLKKNVEGFNVEIINKIISFKNEEVIFKDGCLTGNYSNSISSWENERWDDGKNKADEDLIDAITFKKLISSIPEDIDFIKTDCEGGEYFIFNDENMPLLKTIRTIVGEFHLQDPSSKIEFRYFRDKYLTQFPNYEVRSLDNIDIKWDLFNDHFINYYDQVMIYINNK
tara:strand:+ start:35 stop:766 length:732 start_codon:yes stop_codon:yes gene_type:complete